MAGKNKFPVKLIRPLVFFDIEATGISPRSDRIVEIFLLKLHPDGTRESKAYRLNPQKPIPSEAIAIHGITDDDVKDSPVFSDVASDIIKFIEGCDLAGYNLLKYDIPLLAEEFLRANLAFDPDNYRVVDVQRIYHKKEPRDLTAALAFYCNEMHLNAHGAEADVLATVRVFEGQYKRYSDLPSDVEGLDKLCSTRDPSWVDRTGRLRWDGGEIVLNFGRKKGTPLVQVIENDPGFVKWMLRSDFPPDTRAIVENAAAGKWPDKPGGHQIPE